MASSDYSRQTAGLDLISLDRRTREKLLFSGQSCTLERRNSRLRRVTFRCRLETNSSRDHRLCESLPSEPPRIADQETDTRDLAMDSCRIHLLLFLSILGNGSGFGRRILTVGSLDDRISASRPTHARNLLLQVPLVT